jgi:hypothetical protein
MKLVRTNSRITPGAARQASPTHSRRGGFTLIETAMVMTLIGLGVLAMLELLAAGSVSNAYGTEMTTAVHLANNIHEISLGLAFADPENPLVWNTKEPAGITACDNVIDLDGTSFSPPLDVRRQTMPNYTGWGQRVKVESVAEDYVASVRPNTLAEPTVRVTVTIFHHGRDIYTTSWLAVAPAPE